VRAGNHIKEAEVLARAIGDQHRLARITAFMAITCVIAGDYDAAVGFGQEALAIARTRGDRSIEGLATTLLGRAHFVRGEFSDAVTFFERSLALVGDLRSERFSGGANPAALSRDGLAETFSEFGRFDAAIGHAEAAVRIGEETDHPFTLSFALITLGLMLLHRGHLPRATRVLERVLDHSHLWQIRASYAAAAPLGTAYALAGRAEEAIRLVAGAVEEFHLHPIYFRPALIFLNAGMTCLAVRRIDEASGHAHEALALARRLGARGSEAHALCLNGDIAVAAGAKDAEGLYRQALALAEPRGMRPQVAHCHFGLGKLHRRRGDRQQAEERLTTAIAMYREMGMTYWLERAEAELRQLG
jgi:tetratricopeptide (TPR) repeat protein